MSAKVATKKPSKKQKRNAKKNAPFVLGSEIEPTLTRDEFLDTLWKVIRPEKENASP